MHGRAGLSQDKWKTTEANHQIDDPLSRREMIREQIHTIHSPTDLPQFDGGILHPLMDQQRAGVDAPKLAEATLTADADRRGGTGPHP